MLPYSRWSKLFVKKTSVIMGEFSFQRRYRGPLKAVLFDWAGTTLDFGSCAPAAAFVKVFKQHGIDITTEEAREPMGANKKTHIRQITQIPAVMRRWQQVFGRDPNEEDVEAMYGQFVPLQVACLRDYADLIPGCAETVEAIRHRGMKIGSTTGYTTEMMAVLTEEGKRQGFEPDAVVCATDVPEGRPAPWMCLENARQLGVYPMESIVKVDDTVPGIEAGLNAGMWTIGVARTGNEMGLSEQEIEALPSQDYRRRIERAYNRLAQSGAHYVVDAITDVPACLDDIQRRLMNGENP